MLNAYGWVIARSSREPYLGVLPDDIDPIDDQVDRADEELFGRLEQFLAEHEMPNLDWHFRRHMNHADGVLLMSASRNHRSGQPTIIDVLYWLADNGPGSYGLVFLHDDEDGRSADGANRSPGTTCSNVFRVWRLLGGKVEELDDPFLSPIVPLIDPTEYA